MKGQKGIRYKKQNKTKQNKKADPPQRRSLQKRELRAQVSSSLQVSQYSIPGALMTVAAQSTGNTFRDRF
jgi:hypothetical protein